MSKGGEYKENHSGFLRDSINCELCGSQASLYCQADDAYLCRECDKWVHKANFLAFRHIRCFLCKTCQNLTRRYLIGASLEVILPPAKVSLYGTIANGKLLSISKGKKLLNTKRSKGN